MSQSLVKNYLHIVYSTKHREPLIREEIEEQLYSYTAATCAELNCQPIKVGGWFDHIHIVCMLSKSLALTKLLEKVKSHSSAWMKTNGDFYSNFFWQGGYAAFSISPDEVDSVVAYVDNQKDHHKTISFQDELRSLFKKYNVDYDERYLWD